MAGKSLDVIAVGAVLVDMIAQVDEFPGKDGESFVKDFKMMPGGAAANVAVLCSRLGLKTAFLGKIGQDDFGQYLHKDLQEEKVIVDDFLVSTNKSSTGSCYVCVNKDGDRMILAHSGAADTLSIEDLPVEAITKCRWFHLSDLRNVGAIEALFEEDIKVNFSLSPGALIAQNPSRAYRLAAKAKLIVSSKDEFTQIFRCTEEDMKSVAENLIFDDREKIIVITHGGKGATIYSKKGWVTIPIFSVPVVDTTGAGDAFAAGMLYSLVKKKPLEEAGLFAAACSALCIQEIGARSGPKTRKEVAKFLKKYDK